MFKRILVPVDGSATAAAGLRAALRLAQEQGARVRLVHLSDRIPPPRRGDEGLTIARLRELMKESGEKLLARQASRCRSAGVKADTALYIALAERAFKAILEEARKWRADVIVMGTHGRRGLRRMALGSDAEEVVRGSRVPVLLVRR